MENIKVKVDNNEFKTSINPSVLDEVCYNGERYKVEVLKTYKIYIGSPVLQ